jgi:hypothetical protein
MATKKELAGKKKVSPPKAGIHDLARRKKNLTEEQASKVKGGRIVVPIIFEERPPNSLGG